MNKVTVTRRNVYDIFMINTHEKFHEYLIRDSLNSLFKTQNSIESILAVGADHKEALLFKEFPFKKIKITGFNTPYDRLQRLVADSDAISYEQQNMENLTLETASFDVVFCKEALHHLARPVLGLYEMLRVCEKAVVLIEPYDTLIGKIFEFLKISSLYEKKQDGNINSRDNFVFRWNKRYLAHLLNSYYLESGYTLDIKLGWMSSRILRKSIFLRLVYIIVGGIVGLFPGNKGNYMTAIIKPGNNLPSDPFPIQ